MPLPTRKPLEPEDKFMRRCMSNSTMRAEFPDQKIRAGVCQTQFKKRQGDKPMTKLAIEDVTIEKVTELSDNQLYGLRMRCLQVWNSGLAEGKVEKAGYHSREDFIQKYGIISDEMTRRSLPSSPTVLDQYIFKRAMYGGLEPTALGDIVVQENEICVKGLFVSDPRAATEIMLSLRGQLASAVPKSNAILQQVADSITGQVGTDKEVKVVTEDTPDETYIPLYDLVLRPKNQLVRVVVMKEHELFEHTDEVAKPEPEWIDINREQHNHLPRIAFAVLGDPDDPYTWSGAHHYVVNPTGRDIQDKYIGGKLMLSRAGLLEALFMTGGSPAQMVRQDGGDNDAKRHLQRHGLVLGLIGGEKDLEAQDEVQPERRTVDAATKARKRLETDFTFSISKIDKKEHIVGGIVYEPNAVDAQGDFTDQEEIRQAMYFWMEKGHALKIMHKGQERKDLMLLESFQAEEDTRKGGKKLPKGAWYASVRVKSGPIWDAVEKGQITGFSFGGVAQTVEE